jgi:hypothetical protein
MTDKQRWCENKRLLNYWIKTILIKRQVKESYRLFVDFDTQFLVICPEKAKKREVLSPNFKLIDMYIHSLDKQVKFTDADYADLYEDIREQIYRVEASEDIVLFGS